MIAPDRRHRWLVVAVALFAASSLELAWSVVALRGKPWVGMQFLPGEGPDSPLPEALRAVPILRPGTVSRVVAGSPAAGAGIREGDRVLSIDGVGSDDVEGLRTLGSRLDVGDVVAVRLEREGRSIEASVRLGSPLRSPAFVLPLATSELLALFCLGSGLFVFLRLRDQPAAVYLLLSAVLGAVASIASPVAGASFSPTGVNDPVALGSGYWTTLGVLLFSALLAGPLLLHLVLVFPRERPVVRRWRSLNTWMYGGAFVPVLSLIVVLVQAFAGPFPDAPRAATAVAAGGLAAAILLGWGTVRSVREEGWLRASVSRPLRGLSLLGILAPLAFAVLRAADSLDLVPGGAGSLTALLVAFPVVVIELVAVVVVYPVATGVAAARTYREGGPEERARARWPIWGTGASTVGLVALVAAGWALSPRTAAPSLAASLVLDTLGKLFGALIPLSFVVALLDLHPWPSRSPLDGR